MTFTQKGQMGKLASNMTCGRSAYVGGVCLADTQSIRYHTYCQTLFLMIVLYIGAVRKQANAIANVINMESQHGYIVFLWFFTVELQPHHRRLPHSGNIHNKVTVKGPVKQFKWIHQLLPYNHKQNTPGPCAYCKRYSILLLDIQTYNLTNKIGCYPFELHMNSHPNMTLQ